jgi:flagellar M-ring protein FliF
MAEATTLDNAAAPVAVNDSGGMLSSVRRMTSDPSVKKSLPAILSVIGVVVGLVLYVVMQQPSVSPLYAGLPESEKARVVEALKNAGVDVSLDPSTGDILVPTTDYHTSRMTLAAQGLPESVPDGYSTIGDIPMGSSRSVENIKIKQVQEIEIAKSIGEIEGVIAARVHLALPEKSGICAIRCST